MTRVVDVNTPENVRIEYELAGIGSRGLATLVDGALITVMLLLAALFGWFLAYYGLLAFSKLVWSILVVCAFLVFTGYYVLFESIWNGQTPGKRAVGIRTVRDGGAPIDLAAATIRNLVRSVDSLPSMYMIGMLSILFSRGNKRLGDYAAGTIVVKERPRDIGAPEHKWVYANEAQSDWTFAFDVYLVRPEEFEAARGYCERRVELTADVRVPLAARIAEPIMTRLGLGIEPSTDFDTFLDELCSRCVNERGMR
jgi:uncharacterized RDD family membrane protein YckC